MVRNLQIDKSVRVAIVGSGYVGLVAAACLAELGHTVVCVDNDESKIKALQSGRVPIFEELLPELLQRHSGSKLSFTTELAEAVQNSEAIFIAVGTPPLENGNADLSYVETVAAEVARSINGYKVIVEKSTVPVYTSEWIRRVLRLNGVDPNLFDVVSNPEFLREGTAVVDFLHPDRIVVGADTDRAADLLDRIYAPLTSGEYYERAGSIPGPLSSQMPAPLLRTSAKSAELIKHASNAFLAMKISFINSVSNVCDKVQADVAEVAKGIGMDRRIGPNFLSAGLGYGGSCFPKDLKAFQAVGTEAGVNLDLLKEVELINGRQQLLFIAKVREALWTLRGKRIGVLGLAFKGGTDDLRESPAIEIVKQLHQHGCTIRAYDPAAMPNARRVLPESVEMASDCYDAVADADAAVVLTDWKEFGELDLAKLRSTLRYPIVIDGRNLFPPERMRDFGFTYYSVGRPPAIPQRPARNRAAAD